MLGEALLYIAAGLFSIGYFIFAGFVSYAAASDRPRARERLILVFIGIYGVICALAWLAFD